MIRCLFCGRKDHETRTGIYQTKPNSGEGICIYCCRAAIRQLGSFNETDPERDNVVSLASVDHRMRRRGGEVVELPHGGEVA